MNLLKWSVVVMLLAWIPIGQATEAITREQALKEVHQAARASAASSKDASAQEEALREKLITQAARNYGVQTGRYARWLEIEEQLNKRAIELDQAFVFQRLYLRGGTLQPPVLDVADDLRAIEEDGRLRRLVSRSYRTLVQARFRNSPLSWRDFMLLDELAKPPLPRETLLPANSVERTQWAVALDAGWREGQEMANEEFDLRLEALQRAFRGMVLYGLLARHGMIDPPQIVERRSGDVVVSDKGDELLIGTREEILSQDAFFVGTPNKWRPLDYGFVEPTEESRGGSDGRQ